MEKPLQLIINPGSTTTKIALYAGTRELLSSCIEHPREELKAFGSVAGQLFHRSELIDSFLTEHEISISDLDLVMGRGGLLHPLEGGVYAVNSDMLSDLREARYGEHASNLGALLAHGIAAGAGVPAYIADPVVVDELMPEARISGMPELERKSIFHALNQRIAAREAAEALGKRYEESSLIVAHLGGGISVGAHVRGRVVDVNNALDGEGPFSPERSGGLPAGDLARLCFSGSCTPQQLQRRICGDGGMSAYLGTSDMRAIMKRAEADPGGREALLVRALVHQVAKEIGGLSTVCRGELDAIVCTGGMAGSSRLIAMLSEAVSHLAPIRVIPGEREMLSLAENGSAVYDGRREVAYYERL